MMIDFMSKDPELLSRRRISPGVDRSSLKGQDAFRRHIVMGLRVQSSETVYVRVEQRSSSGRRARLGKER